MKLSLEVYARYFEEIFLHCRSVTRLACVTSYDTAENLEGMTEKTPQQPFSVIPGNTVG